MTRILNGWDIRYKFTLLEVFSFIRRYWTVWIVTFASWLCTFKVNFVGPFSHIFVNLWRFDLWNYIFWVVSSINFFWRVWIANLGYAKLQKEKVVDGFLIPWPIAGYNCSCTFLEACVMISCLNRCKNNPIDTLFSS